MTWKHRSLADERGFTLPEVMIVIVIMGILFGIATGSWFGLVESRRVDSATNQLAADLRLAHTRATNQLASWRVVLVLDRGAESAGADYYLIKLDPAGNVIDSSKVSRTLPNDIGVRNTAPALNDDPTITALYTSLSLGSDPSRTLEFNADGSMDTYDTVPLAADRDLVEVTEDEDPVGRMRFNEVTSRIKID